MAVTPTMLFQVPQQEVASLIRDRIAQATAISIVTGFATPGGLNAIAGPLLTDPVRLETLIVGAATYPAFEVLDDLISAGVPQNRLYVHLGHTRVTGGRKNPFARYHPMLHSKIYFMELPGSKAAVFIGSHNLTSFALGGLNGEAAIMLEGPSNAPEFEAVRQHIGAARSQAVTYSPALKEAYAWWSRQFLEGLSAEMHIPHDWSTVRTILVLAIAAKSDRPKPGEQLYFEIPAGIEQIESLKTEVHLFLFDSLPADPRDALDQMSVAVGRYRCRTLGADNRQGNREVKADWRIDRAPSSTLCSIPSGIYRPAPPAHMQQVRAEIMAEDIPPFEYQFERERLGWDPKLSSTDILSAPAELTLPADVRPVDRIVMMGASSRETPQSWKLVTGLHPRLGPAKESDQSALRLAAPESGSFILVSLRRRPKGHVEASDEG